MGPTEEHNDGGGIKLIFILNSPHPTLLFGWLLCTGKDCSAATCLIWFEKSGLAGMQEAGVAVRLRLRLMLRLRLRANNGAWSSGVGVFRINGAMRSILERELGKLRREG